MKIDQEESDKLKLNKVLNNGAEIIGSVSGTLLGFLLAGFPGAIVGAASSPPITNTLKRLGTEISDQIMAPREKERISATYVKAVELIKGKLESGDFPRSDEFFKSKEDDRSSAETILEGILQKAKNEHEEKKLIYYSYFLCNITFDIAINFEQSVTYLKIIDRLSYQQLCLISHLGDQKRLDFKDWGIFFNKNSESDKFLDFYYELVELFEMKIFKQFDGAKLGGPKNGELSLIGCNLYNLMELSNIPNTDKNLIINSNFAPN